MEPDPAGVVVDVARAILDDLPALTTEMTDWFIEVIPEFRHDEVVRRLMVSSTAANLNAIVDMLVHDIPLEQIAVPAAAAEYARLFAQHDLSLEALLRAYRLGEHRFVTWGVSALDARAHEVDTRLALAAVTHLTRRVNRYIDHVIEGLITIYEAERREWDGRAGADRAIQIRTLLNAEGVSQESAQKLVDVPLDGHHQAAIAWVPADEPPTGTLKAVTRVLADVAGRAPLTMMADDRTLWAWVSGPTPPQLDVTALREGLGSLPEVTMTLGAPGRGLDGFRGSLREAQRARAIVGRMQHPSPVTRFDDVAVTALLTSDLTDLHRWVERKLPGLLGDDASLAQLRETVRVYLACNGSYTQAALQLHMHKNTVRYRVRKVEELTGRSLLEDRLDVEVALRASEQLRNRTR
ncbi:PucR family transcriptional regulator [Nitriliruptor alkaliphilus]|uniref:PucR family transcriptional regulator n=1 Tax=Nitriliruptor alkaliphilus TaxID=427918 RepID=UPI000698CA4E|nr:PucR family transcriptional regulator [Nitriliruptor alkaliphilus]